MLKQIARVIRMDASIYPEVIEDPKGTRKATLVVVIIAISGFIGSALQVLIGSEPKGSSRNGYILGAVISALLQWLIWSYITYFIGTTIFRGKSTPQHMMRALGYAKAPQVFSVFGFIPVIGPIIVVISSLLALRAGSLAASSSLGLKTGKAVATMIVSFVVAFLLAAIVRAILGKIGILQALTSP